MRSLKGSKVLLVVVVLGSRKGLLAVDVFLEEAAEVVFNCN